MLGARPGPGARVLPLLMALVVFLTLGGTALWARQQDGARRRAEAELGQVQAELQEVRVTLTAVLRAQAQASATAAARANEPGPALERALAILFAAYQEPSEARIRALTDVFSPAALAVVRSEAEHLLANRLRLGGESGFQVDVLAATPQGSDRSEVRTRERWTYDRVDQAGRRQRCLREEGEVTYTLRRVASGWLVDEVKLGPTRRSDC